MLLKIGDGQSLGNKTLQTPVTSAAVFPFAVPQTQFNFIKDGRLVFHAQVNTLGGRGHFTCSLNLSSSHQRLLAKFRGEGSASALKMQPAKISPKYMYISIRLQKFTAQNIVMFYQYFSKKNIKIDEEFKCIIFNVKAAYINAILRTRVRPDLVANKETKKLGKYIDLICTNVCTCIYEYNIT